MKFILALVLTTLTMNAWCGDTTGFSNRSAARDALIANASKVAPSASGAQTYVDCNGNKLPAAPGTAISAACLQAATLSTITVAEPIAAPAPATTTTMQAMPALIQLPAF